MEPPYRQEVVVKDVEMSFGSMVVFMLKWTLASIPAMLIILAIGWAFTVLFAGVVDALGPAPADVVAPSRR